MPSSLATGLWRRYFGKGERGGHEGFAMGCHPDRDNNRLAGTLPIKNYLIF